jgi:sugar-specific transcriptional regulator TrmB
MNTCPTPLAEDFLKWSKEMSAIEARWLKVRKQIVNFLKSCKSLNEALKLWPDVRIYIPDEFIKRVERKVEREVSISKAASALANVDTDAAISAAMTARLMGSMQGLK